MQACSIPQVKKQRTSMITDDKATAPTIERIEIRETVKVVQSNNNELHCSIMFYVSHIVTKRTCSNCM